MAGNDGTTGLCVYNGGLRLGALRHILARAGWQLRSGWPRAGDRVAVWGAAPTAWRGHWVARRSGAPLLHVEDAFLRSVLPARIARGRSAPRGWRRLARRPPLGLILDPHGLHFDPARPCLFEHLVDADAAQTARARAGIAFLRHHGLSKYSQHLADAALPPAGCVLVIDQTRHDAALMGAGRGLFLRMLDAARAENPGRMIVIRSHPETAAGLRPGHLTPADLRKGERFHDAPANPWAMLARAHRVYAVSSQLGYEAMLAGHRPRLFGLPFHAGWGLSDDEYPLPRSGRGRATIEALFTATHLTGPLWFDPCRDRVADFETIARQLDAEARAWRQDHAGHRAAAMRLWKRPALVRAFGNGRGVRFGTDASRPPTLIWASAADDTPDPHGPGLRDSGPRHAGPYHAAPYDAGPGDAPPGDAGPGDAPKDDAARHNTGPRHGMPPGIGAHGIDPHDGHRHDGGHSDPCDCGPAPDCAPARRALRVEDGFIRSRGLGAALVPPLALVADDLGIYYDPGRPSRLESLIAAPLPPGGRARAEALIARLRDGGIGKYNLGGDQPRITAARGQRVILVPGQVDDDTSVRRGATGAVRDNAGLLAQVRAGNPDALLIYKPHPDVEAGLRPGTITAASAAQANLIARDADPMALLAQVDAVWTLTSTLGFEALIRGLPVTCLGAPFYAGWGLTRDLAPTPARRRARPDLAHLVHAALIDYPRYTDPVSGRPCPVEVALDRLAEGQSPAPAALRLLSKLQGLLASQSWIWR